MFELRIVIKYLLQSHSFLVHSQLFFILNELASDFESDGVTEHRVYGGFFCLFSRWSQLRNVYWVYKIHLFHADCTTVAPKNSLRSLPRTEDRVSLSFWLVLDPVFGLPSAATRLLNQLVWRLVSFMYLCRLKLPHPSHAQWPYWNLVTAIKTMPRYSSSPILAVLYFFWQ